MKTNIPAKLELACGTVVTNLWDKAAGKERVYLAFESGKEIGYIDIASRSFIKTGKAWGSIYIGNQAPAQIAALIETLEVVADEPAKVPANPSTENDDYATPRDIRAEKAIMRGGGLHLLTLGYNFDDM